MTDWRMLLKEKKLKVTPNRLAVLTLLEKSHGPFTAIEILSGVKPKLDQATLYRILEIFEQQGLVKAVEFGDGKKRFELNLHNHHHHLVCTNCKTVEDIFVHNDVKHVEQKIAKLKKFQIQTHSLEFFGLCKNCQ
jgi:Fur family ferric uptake transcriptional regulator